ncbi:MAG: hypothetical protein JW741_08630, partial [Sedimentisphaerales bacterium]|nr:hypothetical protein [Sedimentisphaerales bacterium]
GFFADESCGKCVPCREGTRQMFRILTRISRGEGTSEDIPTLERLAEAMTVASSCGLGTMAPGPVLAALEHFRDEFDRHIDDGTCPAGVCPMAAKNEPVSAGLRG